MGYEEILSQYQQLIKEEEERLKKRRTELYEELASELASREVLGGKIQKEGIGAIERTHEDYLATLRGKYADLYAQTTRDILLQKEKEKEAKKARKAQFFQTGIQLLTTPWQYTSEGKPEKVLGSVGWDLIKGWIKAKGKKKGEKIPLRIEELANRYMSFLRPTAGRGTSGYGLGIPKIQHPKF